MNSPQNRPSESEWEDEESFSLLDLLIPLVGRWKFLVFTPLLAGVLALAVTYLIRPTFTSKALFIPPQAQQSSAVAALASLGALSGLAGAASGIKNPADQYLALLQSDNISDRIIDGFKLISVYDVDYRFQARKKLSKNVQITSGKRDGLMAIEVTDVDPERAAKIANQYVDELRRLTAFLALTEAQQRRMFFEGQLKTTRGNLTSAQIALETSGFNPGALKAEPRAAAENYARARANSTAADIQLQSLRERLADNAPEVRQQQTLVSALRAEVRKLETTKNDESDPSYIAKYREFKYQEAMFDLFARQFELARLDESREGALIQMVDVAKPAEWKSAPKRALISVAVTVLVFVLLVVFVFIQYRWRARQADPEVARKMDHLRALLGRPAATNRT